MRLGEIKEILKKILNEDNEILIDNTSIYGGQAYTIKNYGDIIKALEILFNQSWNEHDDTEIKKIIQKYGKNRVSAQLDLSEYNQFSSYIGSLDQDIGYYYSILETMANDQDPYLINIKLPKESITSLKELSEFNSRLDKLLKLFNVDGQFEFKGIDKGTTWYEICAIGTSSFTALLACLKISREILEQKKIYWEGKKVELDFKASLKNDSEFTKKGLEEYIEKRINLAIRDLLEEELKKMSLTTTKSSIELLNQLTKGTETLMQEISKYGTEFHLSLNPPEYVKETSHEIIIDYSKYKELESTHTEIKELKVGDSKS